MKIDYDLLAKIYDVEVWDGYSGEELKERMEGFDTIPSVLSDFWGKCGKTVKLFENSNDHWITLDFIRKYNWTKRIKDYFYLLNENQGVYQVAIRRADMVEDDPPVYVVETDSDGTVREIGRAEASVSAFFMAMLLYEAGISGFEFATEDFIWYEEEEIKKIERLLTKYPYHVYNWYSERIDLYTISGDEILFILQGDSPNGTYSAKTTVAYEKIDQLIGDLGER